MQIFAADIMVNANNPALHKSMAALCGVRVNVAPSVFFRRVANGAVLRVLWANASVGRKFVRHEVGASVNFLTNRASNRCHRHIRDNATAKLASTFNSNEHRSFAGSTSASAGSFVAR